MDEQIRKLKELVDGSHNIVFFGGAGVSTESGIPDFRSVDGLYHQKFRYPPETMLSHSFYMAHKAEFYEFYRAKMLAPDARPNAAHRKLAQWEQEGKLKAVITQNIDGLHQKAGSREVLELHGSVLRNYCERCHKFYGLDAILHSTGVPKCTCGGDIKPDVVLYEEALNDRVIDLLADKLLEYQSKENTRLPVLQAELKEVKRRIDNLVAAIEQGILTPATKARMEELEQQREALETGILQEQIEKPPITREQILFWFDQFRHGDPADIAFQEKVIDCFVNSIYLFDDRIVVNFNYQESGRKVSLEEVLSSFLDGNGAPQKALRKRKAFFIMIAALCECFRFAADFNPSQRLFLFCRGEIHPSRRCNNSRKRLGRVILVAMHRGNMLY